MAFAPGALEGVRVLDLSRVLAGPWATQILGDLGADVVKVEKPGAGDDTRAWGPPFVEGGDAAYFLAANRNKRSIAVDFTKPQGAAILRALVKESHIFVENFKTGGLAKYGLDFASLIAINPALVYCSVTGFGQEGPYAQRAGYDYLIQAMGGLMSITGQPDGTPGAEPMKVGVAVADLFTGMYAVTGILAALRHAERTGVGQHLDVSLLDCQLAMLGNQAMNYFTSGTAPARLGNAHPNIAPYQVFATADGFLVLAIGNDGQFQSFCRAAQAPDLSVNPAYASNASRVAHRADLIPLVAALMLQRTTKEWIAVLEEANVPCGPINTIDQAFADPHAQARDAAHVMTRANGQSVTLVASPLRLSQTPAQPRFAPPLLAADTDQVLAERLGASAAQLKAWREEGVL
jgi:crotonobetainyl-CoA:carnitine CoA-transferase CaiB-like acyl-CoA transferase